MRFFDKAIMNTLKNEIIKKLSECIFNQFKLKKGHLNSQVFATYLECFERSKHFMTSVDNDETGLFEIDSVLDFLHEELNTGHWSEVPLDLKQNFTIATFIKVSLLLRSIETVSVDIIQECIRCLDMGLLLGAPLEDNPEILSGSAKLLTCKLESLKSNECLQTLTAVKRKFEDDEVKQIFNDLCGIAVDELEIPSLETFNNNYFKTQIPVKLKGCMGHWPATTKWLDLNYLLHVAGNRTVPVEIGSHYADDSWSQKLMTVKEFVMRHYLSEQGDIGYLAQHNLFDQIIELKEDIRIPEYCCCSFDYEKLIDPDINAWFGPKGTISPLHQDPKNNILAQVYGTKQLLLYAPKDTDYLYPYEEKMLSNTAQVDPLNLDEFKFPNFKNAKMYKCFLEPGEMLFIPTKWWHHVTALDKSFSVSFWWQ